MPAETAPLSLALGFNDPVGGTQRTFRRILLAMSRPGMIVDLTDGDLADPAPGLPLGQAAAAVALTLVDMDTPVWLGEGCGEAMDYLRFHCGAKTSRPEACRFAFADAAAALPALDGFDLGNSEFPDRSTTLVLEVPHLQGGAALDSLTLRGPGIEDAALLRVGGTGADFWREWQELRPLFPLGIDLILTCGRQMAALPRTTSVET